MLKLFLPAFAVPRGRGGGQHPLRRTLKSKEAYLEKRLLLLHVLLEFLILEVQGLLEGLQPAGPVLPLCLNLSQPDHLRLKLDSFTRRIFFSFNNFTSTVSSRYGNFSQLHFTGAPTDIDFRVIALQKLTERILRISEQKCHRR